MCPCHLGGVVEKEQRLGAAVWRRGAKKLCPRVVVWHVVLEHLGKAGRLEAGHHWAAAASGKGRPPAGVHGKKQRCAPRGGREARGVQGFGGCCIVLVIVTVQLQLYQLL